MSIIQLGRLGFCPEATVNLFRNSHPEMRHFELGTMRDLKLTLKGWIELSFIKLTKWLCEDELIQPV